MRKSNNYFILVMRKGIPFNKSGVSKVLQSKTKMILRKTIKKEFDYRLSYT